MSQLETICSNPAFHRRRRMHKRAERICRDLTAQILKRHSEPDVPHVSRIRACETTAGVLCRLLEQLFVVVVAADNAVERDEIGNWQLSSHLDEIPLDESR